MSKTNRGCKVTRLLSLIAFLLLLDAAQAQAQETAFIYQGKLGDSGIPANGNYDFEFKLFDTAAVGTGTQQGSTLQRLNVDVANGIFTVSLDFGACGNCFDGTARFLEISVKLTSGGTFTTLGPRQPFTSTPYALKSLNAGTADGLSVACLNCITSNQIASLDGSKVAGPIPVASVPGGSGNYIQNTTTQQAATDFNISGDGTVGGTLSANIVSATMHYNFGVDRVLAIGGTGGNIHSNTFVGVGAGAANPTGSTNSFFGKSAGALTTTGSQNAFFGSGAGNFNTTGFNNSFFGSTAGRLNSSGSNNAYVGTNAGINSTTGANNAFFGSGAGSDNTTGSENAFFGMQGGRNNTSGINNSFFGRSAGFNNIAGGNNSFFGHSAGLSNSSGSNNTLFGANANVGVGNLDHATALGADAVVSTSNTIALGRSSGADAVLVPGNLTVTGTLTATLPSGSNSYIQNRLSPQASSDFNISGSGTVGGTFTAQTINTTSFSYRINGDHVLRVAGDRLYVGRNSGLNDISGSGNSFFGDGAGRDNNPGHHNSFFGQLTGTSNQSGNYNSFFGRSAGIANTTGSSNSFFGLSAGNANTTASNNSFFGFLAGLANTTGSDNTVIGSRADVGSNNLTFATALGAEAVVNANDTIVLGKVAGTYSGTSRPADTVRVPGKILAEADAGSAVAVGVGEYYRDNAIVAWAKITGSGTLTGDFGISAIAHTATGIYTITLTASAASTSLLIPVAIAEIENAPTTAASLRIVSINQMSTTSFQVFINNGAGALVDNDFVFIATAR